MDSFCPRNESTCVQYETISLNTITVDVVREGYAELTGKNQLKLPTRSSKFSYLCIGAFIFILQGARMIQFVFSDPISASTEVATGITFINTKE